MDPIIELLKLTSIATLVFAYAATEAGVFAVRKDDQGKLPRWFVFVPIACSFVFAVVEYFALTPTEETLALTMGKKFAIVLYRGFIASAASIAVFELRKKISSTLRSQFQARFGGKGNDQTPPGPTP